MKNFLSLLVLLCITAIPNVFANDSISININDQLLALDSMPYVKDGRTMVPFRKILETFHAEVNWDNTNQVVSAKSKDTEVLMQIGTKYAYVNGNRIPLDVPPEITDGKTFIPLRFIGESLGAEVKWDDETNTININYNNSTYSLGQTGEYKDLNFSIDKVTLTDEGSLKVTGSSSGANVKLILDVGDDLGYVLTGHAVFTSKSSNRNTFESVIELPSCHNFEATKVVLKLINEDNKLIKIGRYTL